MENIKKATGVALQVVKAEADHSFSLDEQALANILLDHRVANNKVVIISVAGAYRKGKSFLLDFFLRFLQFQQEKKDNWMSDEDSPLLGFPWKGGSERTTSGILLWSEPFVVETVNNEKVCILLMDTQGAFDSQSTVKDCATVFALSTMLSSVQIFNISSNVQEDDLQHLELFTDYGRLALQESEKKPFQHLYFLVRDWSYPYQFKYGADGGGELLEKRLQISNTQHKELQKLRQNIRDCFKVIGCFLMPHPGLKVATSQKFQGQLSDIEEEFKVYIKQFVESILLPEKMIVKKINGVAITGKELIEYFRAYMKMYQGNELPEPKTMLQATAEANNLAAVANAKDFYAKEMEKVCGGDKPYIQPEQLTQEHTRNKKLTLEQFDAIKKMGGAVFSQSYREKLEEELQEMLDTYLKNNESKHMFTATQTPVLLLTCSLILYTLSYLLSTLGMESIAQIANFLTLISLFVIVAWTYSKFTGNYSQVGLTIDKCAGQVHKVVFKKSAPKIETIKKKTN